MVVVVAALTGLVALLSAGAPCKVAVLTVDGAGFDDQATLSALTESVADGARDASGCQVITPRDVKSMLSFAADQQACSADDASCLSEIGTALGVKRIVATSVSKLGAAWTVSVRLIDIEGAQVLQGRERVVVGDAVALRDVTHELARSVFGAWSPLTTGLIYGGAAGVAVGVAVVVMGGGAWAWSSSKLAERSASGADKTQALALYTPSLVGVGGGALVFAAGASSVVAGIVSE